MHLPLYPNGHIADFGKMWENASGLYAIDAADDASLRNKCDELRCETATRKAIHFTFITVYGVKENAYLKNIQSQLTLKDLFR